MANSGLIFVFFSSFSHTILIQIVKSVHIILGIRTRGHRMVGADGWWLPYAVFVIVL